MARACPACGSARALALAAFTPRALFRSNWSYRREALDELGAEADTPWPIVQCEACGFVFAAEVPPAPMLEFIYERAIDAGKAREDNGSPANAAAKMRVLSTLLALAPRRKPLRVLDFGCGFGPNLQLLCAIESVRALGFETSGARLQHLAERKLPAIGNRDQLGAHGPFEALVLDNVLEHLPDPGETLGFLRGLCAPGAVVFVSVPSRSADELKALAAAPDAVPMDVNPLEHLNYFGATHLDAFMQRAGFVALTRSELPDPVNIGLRPIADTAARIKNAAASAARLLRYARTGDVLQDANARFYRCEGDAAH